MTTLTPPPVVAPSVGQTLLTFLENVGQRSEAEMYLRLFRGLPRGRFALVAPTSAVLRDSVGTLAEQLAFLRELGLFASLVIGGVEEVSDDERAWLIEALENVELRPEILDGSSPTCLLEAKALYEAEKLPVFSFAHPDPGQFAELCAAMRPRKVVLLRNAGGLGPHGTSGLEVSPGHFLLGHDSGLAVINLRSDQRVLVEGGHLSRDDVRFLERSRQILEALADGGSTNTTVSIASPLSLVKELFTVRGEGTLVKLGAALSAYSSYTDVDVEKVEGLLIESFGRPVREGFFDRAPLRIYLEQDYRGMALLEPGLGSAAYLSKFAVQPVARGEGLGQDLWWALARENPRVYWRSRSDNPINGWYGSVCDGMQRTRGWNVYWRGAEAKDIPLWIEDALGRPEDLAPRGG